MSVIVEGEPEDTCKSTKSYISEREKLLEEIFWIKNTSFALDIEPDKESKRNKLEVDLILFLVFVSSMFEIYFFRINAADFLNLPDHPIIAMCKIIAYILVFFTIFTLQSSIVIITLDSKPIFYLWYALRAPLYKPEIPHIHRMQKLIEFYPEFAKKLKLKKNNDFSSFSFLYTTFLIKEKLIREIKIKVENNKNGEKKKLKDIQIEERDKVTFKLIKEVNKAKKKESQKNNNPINSFDDILSLLLESNNSTIVRMHKCYGDMLKNLNENKNKLNTTDNTIIKTLRENSENLITNLVTDNLDQESIDKKVNEIDILFIEISKILRARKG